MDNQQALKLLHRYHDATNTRRLDELDDIFAKDFINFAAGFEPVKSLAAMKKLIEELLLAFPDWHVTVEDMFAQDNKVVRLEPDGSQKVLVSGIAKASIHNGGRLRFGPDGTLYASTGDAGQMNLACRWEQV